MADRVKGRRKGTVNDFANALFNDLIDALDAEKLTPVESVAALYFVRDRINDAIEMAVKKAMKRRGKRT